MFHIELFDRGNVPQALPPGLTFEPVRWSHSWRGGPDKAEIAVTGNKFALWRLLQWMRYEVRIRNDVGNYVWWGYINEARVDRGGTVAQKTLDGMTNRVKVQYNYEDVDGLQIADVTDWAEDTALQSEWGTKELITTLSDSDQTQAEAYRDQILEAQKRPIPSTARGRSAGGTLHCLGWWHSLDWEYYANDAGRIEHMVAGGTTNTLGLGVTNSKIAFSGDNWIHSIDGYFSNFDEGTKARVTGSTNNNGTITIQEVDAREVQDYTATTLLTEASDDIKDTARRLSFIDVDDVINVSGFTTSNHNGDHHVRDPGEAHIEIKTTYSNTLAAEAAGDTVTIERGHSMDTTGTVAQVERLGSAITITAHGEEIAQKFENNTGADWTVDQIAIQVQKVGSPTDDVTVGLYNDSGGSIGTLKQAGTIDDGDITSTLRWVWCDMSNAATIEDSTAYWIKISRVGSNDPDDCYRVGIAEDTLYADGDLSLYDGNAWAARPTDADLQFRIWGAELTSTLIDTILDGGDLLNGVDVQVSSGIYDNQYRSGERRRRAEIEDLLDMGDSSGNFLVATVSVDRIAKVTQAPDADDGEIMAVQNDDGTLTDAYSNDFDKGRCVVGGWIRMAGIPASGQDYNGLSPFFAETCEYDARSNRATPTARGARVVL